jgi:hypothetical protein
MSTEHLATHDVLIESDQWVIGICRCRGNIGVAKTAAGLPADVWLDRHRGLHARAILLVPTLEFRKICAREGQALGAALLQQQCRFVGLPLTTFSKKAGVGGKTSDGGYLDLPSQHSGALLKILGGSVSKIWRRPWPENLGWPVKPAALTQRRCVIRQIALAAIWERAAAKTHQRPFLSHGGACCHD